MKTQRILVPIDFSELSDKVIQVAVDYARLFEAKITLFHAYHSQPVMTEYDGLGMNFENVETINLLEDSISGQISSLSSEKVPNEIAETPIVELGTAAQSIIDAAQNYDMVIMGTHGRTGFQRFILGSVAEKVIRGTDKPVLLVEQFSKVFPLKKIMVTTDFSANSFKVFPLVVSIAKKSNAQVELVHIMSKEHFGDMSEIDELVKIREGWMDDIEETFFTGISDKLSKEVIVSSKSTHEAIFELNFSRKYNMIMMATLGKSTLKHLVMGSTAATVARSVETAVLVLKP